MALVIVRIPNEKNSSVVEDPFPEETTLYLDMIENKEKKRKLDDTDDFHVENEPLRSGVVSTRGHSPTRHTPPGGHTTSSTVPTTTTTTSTTTAPTESTWLGETVPPATAAVHHHPTPDATAAGKHRSDDQENEDDLKRELLYRFEILRKSYPFTDIPTFTVHTDYNMMKKQYDFIIRKVHLDSNVDSYKSYLIGGFMVIEFIFSRLGLSMDGFCQQQMFQMSKYEKLLIELGEKSYMPKSSWPVEFRICAMILFNALLFGFSKLILQKTGTNLMSMMNERTEVKPTKKMSGPSMNVI